MTAAAIRDYHATIATVDDTEKYREKIRAGIRVAITERRAAKHAAAAIGNSVPVFRNDDNKPRFDVDIMRQKAAAAVYGDCVDNINDLNDIDGINLALIASHIAASVQKGVYARAAAPKKEKHNVPATLLDLEYKRRNVAITNAVTLNRLYNYFCEYPHAARRFLRRSIPSMILSI